MLRTSLATPMVTATLLAVAPLTAQQHDHARHAGGPAPAPVAPSAGQAAFAAITELVARLDADPATDWTTVDFEALRRHLIDMDQVTLRSRIAERPVPGGFTATVTAGDAEVVGAIRRMLSAHAAQFASSATLRARVVEVSGGVELTVTATGPADARAVARLRGLGAIGFLALDDHHAVHHEMLARGKAAH